MDGLYLQRADGSGAWEEVNEFLWDNWEKARTKDGKQPLYSGNRVQKANGVITVHVDNITSRDLAIIARFCGVKESEAPGAVVGGFVKPPGHVKIVNRGKIILYDPATGETFKASKPIVPVTKIANVPEGKTA